MACLRGRRISQLSRNLAAHRIHSPEEGLSKTDKETADVKAGRVLDGGLSRRGETPKKRAHGDCPRRLEALGRQRTGDTERDAVESPNSVSAGERRSEERPDEAH